MCLLSISVLEAAAAVELSSRKVVEYEQRTSLLARNCKFRLTCKVASSSIQVHNDNGFAVGMSRSNFDSECMKNCECKSASNQGDNNVESASNQDDNTEDEKDIKSTGHDCGEELEVGLPPNLSAMCDFLGIVGWSAEPADSVIARWLSRKMNSL